MKNINSSQAGFNAYIRWLGNRNGIEEQTTTWDKTVIDRQSDLSPDPLLTGFLLHAEALDACVSS